jgi:hypothetical protein
MKRMSFSDEEPPEPYGNIIPTRNAISDDVIMEGGGVVRVSFDADAYHQPLTMRLHYKDAYADISGTCVESADTSEAMRCIFEQLRSRVNVDRRWWNDLVLTTNVASIARQGHPLPTSFQITKIEQWFGHRPYHIQTHLNFRIDQYAQFDFRQPFRPRMKL